MPNTLYDDIAISNFRQYIGNRALSNSRLRDYFNACFQKSIDHHRCYTVWVCVNCIDLAQNKTTAGYGEIPKHCSQCLSSKIFQVATFQSRASVVGNAFESAVIHLLNLRFELPVAKTPGNTNTHDIEITGRRVAIEAKGSPREIRNPDNSVTQLDRPGLERSDTWKKAQANAKNFRSKNKETPFFIVSNAVPTELVGYRSDDITGIFNIAQSARVDSLVSEINAAT